MKSMHCHLHSPPTISCPSQETSIDEISERHRAESGEKENLDSQATENGLAATGEQEEKRNMTVASSEERLTEDHDEQDEIICQVCTMYVYT